MTKKQILSAVLISLVIIVLIGSVLAWYLSKNKETSSASAVQAGVSAQLDPSGATTIPLGESTKKPNSGLSVSDNPTTSANLGSGISIGGSSTGSSSNAAQDFKQYEAYKDKTEVYFGDIVTGTGNQAQKDSQLAVTYKGYLTNGQMFDQSRTGANGAKQPLIFTLGTGQLIAGFEQGVAGMKAGGTRRIIIPPVLGYGDKQQNGIPPNSVLIFDVELLTVQ
jgi:FKBP-type peptidyl-prolyl cis-trans isomerase